MSEPMAARREIAFSRTEMDAVFEMVVSSGNSEPGFTAVA